MCLVAGRTQTPAAAMCWSEKDKQLRTREKRRAVCLPPKKGSKWKNACTTSYPPIQPTPCTQTLKRKVYCKRLYHIRVSNAVVVVERNERASELFLYIS